MTCAPFCIRQLRRPDWHDRLVADYLRLRDTDACHGSHWFGGRYENRYIAPDDLPAVRPLLARARDLAAELLGRPAAELRVGYWFNEMRPGEETGPHSHDEDDELLSGVYYLCVPPASGDLLLGEGARPLRLRPREASFVFFPPELVHAVSRNESEALRLSVGLNIGPRS